MKPTDKCNNCGKEGSSMIDICNYVVTYESWEAFNCCCKECAKEAAIKDGITEDEIIEIEGG